VQLKEDGIGKQIVSDSSINRNVRESEMARATIPRWKNRYE
jgi:hypothetical protein